MARIQCEYRPITFARPYGASRHNRQYHDAHFVQHNPSEHACPLPANQDCRRRLGRGHRRNQVYENVRGHDRAEGESEDSTNDDFVTCHTSTCLTSTLTLRKMSLKPLQMSLNRRNGTEIATDVMEL